MFNISDDLIKQLQDNNVGTRESRIPILKLVLPESNYTWLITSIDKNEPYFAHGLYEYDGNIEFGEIDLEELAQMKGKSIQGIRHSILFSEQQLSDVETVVIDTKFNGVHPLSIYYEVSKELGHICTDDTTNASIWKRFLEKPKR